MSVTQDHRTLTHTLRNVTADYHSLHHAREAQATGEYRVQTSPRWPHHTRLNRGWGTWGGHRCTGQMRWDVGVARGELRPQAAHPTTTRKRMYGWVWQRRNARTWKLLRWEARRGNPLASTPRAAHTAPEDAGIAEHGDTPAAPMGYADVEQWRLKQTGGKRPGVRGVGGRHTPQTQKTHART